MTKGEKQVKPKQSRRLTSRHFTPRAQTNYKPSIIHKHIRPICVLYRIHPTHPYIHGTCSIVYCAVIISWLPNPTLSSLFSSSRIHIPSSPTSTFFHTFYSSYHLSISHKTHSLIQSSSVAIYLPPPTTTITMDAPSSSSSSAQQSPSVQMVPQPAPTQGNNPSTAPFLQDFTLIAEAAKRAQMAIMIRDFEDCGL